MQKNQLNHQIADTVGPACWTPCKLCMGKYALGPEQLHINDQHHTVHGIETTSAMHSQPKKLVFDCVCMHTNCQQLASQLPCSSSFSSSSSSQSSGASSPSSAIESCTCSGSHPDWQSCCSSCCSCEHNIPEVIMDLHQKDHQCLWNDTGEFVQLSARQCTDT